MDIKNLIVKNINYSIPDVNFGDYLTMSASLDKGDYSMPCFAFAKILHLSPVQIANDIAAKVNLNSEIERVEAVNGYVNFFLNSAYIASEILTDFKIEKPQNKNQLVLIDYASPNLAKFLHIGHLKTAIIGESLARMFTFCGYTVKRLNFYGDFGTPFGKIIGGLIKWGSMGEVEKRGIDALQEYYVKFNQAEETDPELSQYARDLFKKIEEKDKKIYPIYEKIIKIAIKETTEMFNFLGLTFDDYRGEMYFSQFAPEVKKVLNDHHLLTESEGAKIVDLSAYNLGVALVEKSDGTSNYASHDLAAAMIRYNEYKFDKLLYVTDVAQSLHFAQVFKTLELCGFDYAKNMEHVPYGRFSLPDGKISSRRGKQAVLIDLIDYVRAKAKEVISTRTFTIEKPEDVVAKVARAVLNFSVLKVERIKDCVFDVEKAFNFDGETAPYMQYTFTWLESILRKHTTSTKSDYSCFNREAFNLVIQINNFVSVVETALNKRDSSVLTNYLMDLCSLFNKFYVNTRVLDGNDSTTQAKVNLVRALRDTLDAGFNLICIDSLKEM